MWICLCLVVFLVVFVSYGVTEKACPPPWRTGLVYLFENMFFTGRGPEGRVLCCKRHPFALRFAVSCRAGDGLLLAGLRVAAWRGRAGASSVEGFAL